MTRVALIVAFALVAGSASAQITLGVFRANSGGGAATAPVTCTVPPLDFSDSCNTTWLALGIP